MATITEVNVAQNLTALWGINAYEYSISGKQVDFQDLMVAVSEKRAVSVEGEVQPLTTRVRTRNKELEILGSLLAKFTQTQSSYDSNATGSSMKPVRGITEEEIPLASEAYRRKGGSPGSNLDWWNSDWSKASVEGMISMLKTMIDSRNNESQSRHPRRRPRAPARLRIAFRTCKLSNLRTFEPANFRTCKPETPPCPSNPSRSRRTATPPPGANRS